ncbi:MAG: hypothetical protein HKN47_08940, partial [Pirellulaceae bacterium]|nr:hypothetical protein [Pirellulaceae bacterium]
MDNELTQDESDARELVDFADRLKSGGEYDEAQRGYRGAMQLDPNWAYPVYQLACNYELSGDHNAAVAEFKRAIELGFDDFPTALGDDELGRIRDRLEFNSELSQIRDRYLQTSKSRIGQPIAIQPDGERPPGGWPVILMLH